MMIEIIDIIQCDGGISMGLATLIAGLAAAGSTAGQAIGAGKMNKRAERYAREENAINRQFQADQAQIGRDFQEEMYNKYYSPSAMMQQFKNAGVNPILAAGQITGQGGMSSPSPAGGSSMQPSFVNPMESFAGITDSIMAISRLKQEIAESKAREHYYNSQGNKAESDIEVNKQTITNMVTENSQMLNDIALSNKKFENECKELDNLIKKTTNEIEQGNQSIKESQKRIEHIDNMIRKLSSDIDLNEQQKSYLASMSTLLDQQLLTEKERTNSERENTKQIKSLTGLHDSQSGYYERQGNVLSEEEWQRKYENKYLSLYGAYPSTVNVLDSPGLTTSHRGRMGKYGNYGGASYLGKKPVK